MRGKEDLRNLKITNSSSITSIGKENDLLNLGFIYSVDYFPNIASIKLEGDLTYNGDISMVDENDKTTITPTISREVHTAILRYCISEIVIIAKQLELIPPIPMPGLESKKKPDNDFKIKDNIYDYR